MSVAFGGETPIIPGQKWRDSRGKHAGREVEIVRTNEHSVFVKVLKGRGKSRDGSSNGQTWTFGLNSFRQNWERMHMSGGNDPHAAPLPPAALRGEPPVVRVTLPENMPEPSLAHITEGSMSLSKVIEEAINVAVDEKRCSKCGAHKPTTQFYKSSKSKDGVAYWCKACAMEGSNASRQKRRAQPVTATESRSEKMSKPEVVETIRAGQKRGFERLTSEQKDEIRKLRAAGESMTEIQRAFGLSGMAFGMVMREADPSYETQLEIVRRRRAERQTKLGLSIPHTIHTTEAPAPEPLVIEPVPPLAPLPEGKHYRVTYTILRPVEVSEAITAASMEDVLAKLRDKTGLTEVLYVEKMP